VAPPADTLASVATGPDVRRPAEVGGGTWVAGQRAAAPSSDAGEAGGARVVMDQAAGPVVGMVVGLAQVAGSAMRRVAESVIVTPKESFRKGGKSPEA